MKQVLKNILLGILSISIFSYTYIKIFKTSVLAVVVILGVILLYGVCMGIREESIKQLKKFENKCRNADLTNKDRFWILFFSLTTLSPTYFCVMLVSSVPLFTYEVWFITVFPCLIIICIPMLTVMDEYHILTRKRLPLLLLFFAVIISIMFGMITLTSTLL